MAIEIKTYGNYKIRYAEQRFYAIDAQGDRAEEAPTEAELIEKLKVLDKRDFKRVQIYRVEQNGHVQVGVITSIDSGVQEAWINMEKDPSHYGSGRSKVYLSSGRDLYYEQTLANIDKVEQIRQRREHIEGILLEIRALRDQLEKPINREYFGM